MANKRLIDANALKDRFNLRIKWLEKDKHDDYTTGIWDGCLYDAKLIDEIPTVDAVEVVHGHWTTLYKVDTWMGTSTIDCFICSECGVSSKCEGNYCPNCGAKMDGGNEDG